MLYLVRHGSTDANRRRVVLGATDVPLSSEGVSQSESAARILKAMGCHPMQIRTSDLLRCVATATLVAGALRLPSAPKIDPRLRERDFGRFEGLSRKALLAEREQLGLAGAADPTQDWDGVSDVESDWGIWVRIGHILGEQEVQQATQAKDILLVTHAGVIRSILRYGCGASLGERTRIYAGHGAIVRLWKDPATSMFTVDQVINPWSAS